MTLQQVIIDNIPLPTSILRIIYCYIIGPEEIDIEIGREIIEIFESDIVHQYITDQQQQQQWAADTAESELEISILSNPDIVSVSWINGRLDQVITESDLYWGNY